MRGPSGVYMAPRYWEWFLDLVVLPLQPEAVLELIFLVSFEDEWPYQEANEEEDVVGPEMHPPCVEDKHEILKKPEVLHHAHLHAHRPCAASAVPGKTHTRSFLSIAAALSAPAAVITVKLLKGTNSPYAFVLPMKAVKPVAHSPETSTPMDAAASCCLPPGPIPNPTEQATPEELRKIRELEELLRSDKTYPPAW